jgi:hypothetical protein
MLTTSKLGTLLATNIGQMDGNKAYDLRFHLYDQIKERSNEK